MSWLVATLLAAAAAWVLVEDTPRSRVRRLAGDVGGSPSRFGGAGASGAVSRARSAALPAPSDRWVFGRGRVRSAAVPAGAVAAAVAVSAVAAARSPVLAFVVPAVVLVVVRRRSTARARRLEQRRREGVVELCAALAAELRAGQSATTALVQAARGTADAASLVASTLAVAETAGDVPSALRRDAAAPGAGALRRIAACWWVAGTAGTSMAPGLSRLARSLRAEEAHRRSVASALAAPRATARLLALLPAVAVLMGTGLGARPLDVLLGTPVGGLLLVAGLSLTAVGVAWTDRLASRAERAG